MSDTTCSILLICGSLRAKSVNAATLLAAQELAPVGAAATMYQGLASLPHFNPDDDQDPLHAAVADLRARLDAADAVLFCTPEYAGTLPGSLKNLLDWAVGGGLYAKPAAWINASPTGALGAHESLRKVLGYVNADVVENACVSIPMFRQSVDAHGLIHDSELRHEIEKAVTALVEHARQGPAR